MVRSRCASSRAFHGGAFVVFSRRLNPELETIALEGAHASVIGGAPAATVVFARDLDVRTRTDPRIADLDERIAAADGPERGRLRTERDERWTAVRAEKLGELAAEFDAIHNVSRAVEVGSVDRVIPASALRADLIDTTERGVRRAKARAAVAGAPAAATPSRRVEARAV
jgi:acetyl-CoA carboxylase carboxyltransferase component